MYFIFKTMPLMTLLVPCPQGMKPLVAFLPVYKDPKIPSWPGLPYLQGIQPLMTLLVASLQGIKPLEACCHVFRAYDPLMALGCQSTGHHTQNCFWYS